MARKTKEKKASKEDLASDLTNRAAIEALSQYVRIDTTNPPGNEAPAAEFLASFLEKRSIPYEILRSPEGRPNLVSRLSAGGDPADAICLMNHMDVVAAEESRWLHDPFGGEIVGGELWGRGALDMKGLGVMQLWAFMHVADAISSNNMKLKRDLLFVAVSDEEEGGAQGAGWLLAEHPSKVACAELLTEGGFGVASVLPGVDAFSCATTEKSAVWMKLEARGDTGHGGIPPDAQAIEQLLACLQKLISRNKRYRMTDQVRRVYISLADSASGVEKAALKAAVGRGGQAVLRLLASKLSRPQRALLRDLVTVTKLEAGYKPNVVPGSASATIDCRPLPDIDVDEFVEEIRKVAERYNVSVEVIFKCDANGDSPKGELFGALQDACRASAPDALFLQSVATGFTDARFWRRTGARCCGLTPSIVSIDLIETMHGDNERIPLGEFERGLEITRSAVEALVLAPAG